MSSSRHSRWVVSLNGRWARTPPVSHYPLPGGAPLGTITTTDGTEIFDKDEADPGGLPKEVFDRFQAGAATRRSQFYATWRRDRFMVLTSQGWKHRRRSSKLVATGHDRRCESPLRRHCRLLADRFNRRPAEDFHAACESGCVSPLVRDGRKGIGGPERRSRGRHRRNERRAPSQMAFAGLVVPSRCHSCRQRHVERVNRKDTSE